VEVTNSANGRSVEVRINDRGPHARDRQLDLSRGAAQRLGLIGPGIGRVQMKTLGTNHLVRNRGPEGRRRTKVVKRRRRSQSASDFF